MRGRPTKAVLALRKQPGDKRFPNLSYYIGAGFAKIFPAYHSEPFIGKVTDIRRPGGVNSVDEVLFKISYAAQLGSVESTEEEIYMGLLAGMKLFKTLHSPVTALEASI